MVMREALLKEYGPAEENEGGDGSSEGASWVSIFFVIKMIKEDCTPCMILENVLLGSIGAAYSKEHLLASNVSHILCVASSPQLKYPDLFAYAKIKIQDRADNDLFAHFSECCHFIDTARSARDGQGVVLVHCYQGVSRSVAIVCAYLIKTLKFSLDQSLDFVREKGRPQANPNSGFIGMLRRWEAQQTAP